MKMFCATILATTLSVQAAQIQFALSPPGTSAGVGLSPSNEVPPVTSSTGSGNVIGSGIVFDTATGVLHMNVGYGSAGGFTDLTGPALMMHIHGAAPPGTNAGVIIDLMPLNQPAANPALGGTVVGDIVFPAGSVSNLLAGLTYMNIHTTMNPGGEIRGQLIPVVTSAPSVVCPGNSTNECGTASTTTVQVSSSSGGTLTVVWTVNGTGTQTNVLADTTAGATTNVSFSAVLPLGTNVLTATVADGASNSASCSTLVTVVDTTPPVINSVTATPTVLWPPNHQMKSIRIQTMITDTCSPTTWKVTGITSSEPADAKGSGHTAADWKITGDHTLTVRAERSGNGTGRVYTITIQAADSSGNTAQTNVTVTVPHDKAPPTPPPHKPTVTPKPKGKRR